MKEENKPIVHMPTLRRDLYIVMSLLLADKKVSEITNMVDWTRDFYETEVRRLLLWIAVAVRGLLDLSKRSKRNRNIEKQLCGEYWPSQSKLKPRELTFRQACNLVVHATEILTYKIPEKELDNTVTRVYDDRITVKSTHGTKKTHAQIDVIRFVQVAYIFANSFEEGHHADG